MEDGQEPKRLKEDFTVVRNFEDQKRSEFKKLFEECKKTADLNRSLIPNDELLE